MNPEVDGFSTVTVSGAVPVSVTAKPSDSLPAVLPKVICLKARFAGAIFISLKGNGFFFAAGWLSWAGAETIFPIVNASVIKTPSAAIRRALTT